jgi:hypothetical protein
MPLQPVSPAILRPHPDNPANAIKTIKAFPRVEGPLLVISYVVDGNVERLQIPAVKTPKRAGRLWESTCFEAFLGEQGSSVYYELNFSPSGEWAVYKFSSYRERLPTLHVAAEPQIAVRRQSDSLELDALFRLDSFLPAIKGEIFRLGLTAVIEDNEGRLSYWSLRHKPGKPDFHDPDTFVLSFSRR